MTSANEAPDEPSAPAIRAALRDAARLARLDVAPAEEAALIARLDELLAHIGRLAEVDVAGAAPLHHPPGPVGRLAPDEPGPTLPAALVAEQAPARDGPYISVPKVIDAGDAG